MKKSRLLWTIAAIIIIVLLCIAFVAYNEYQKLKAVRNLDVKLTDVKIEDLSWTKLTLGFAINVHNPNKIDVNVGDFKATIYANEVPLTAFELTPTSIPAQQSIQKKFSAQFDLLDLGTAFLKAVKEKRLVWMIQGEYTLNLPFGIKYPYKFSKTMETTTPA